jgi:lipopolysaccharide/colanic/teichoic acid biosynthesis glycosyltransferase
MNLRSSTNISGAGPLSPQAVSSENRGVLNEELFRGMISRERKRSERSRKPFLLMLLDMGDLHPSLKNGPILSKILTALSLATRETDVTGWYQNNTVVGVMFTEIGIEDRSSILATMMTRVSQSLCNNLNCEQFDQIRISFHLFPQEWDREIPQEPTEPTLYPDLSKREDGRRLLRVVKRLIDVASSGSAVMILAPLFLVIALAIKTTSKGPVFYRQLRVGQHGVPFVFVKFRSMYIDCDSSVHKDYVRNLIAGRAECNPSNGNGKVVYKLTDDSRITRVGKFLRRTSLDELPQFFNVLKGEMSMVGPRPPIPYEVKAYDIWHRSRLYEAKPGITGLWQVNGRSRVKFDDMVRLDLQYARTWSLWLDFKILIQTPKAVVLGEGAH